MLKYGLAGILGAKSDRRSLKCSVGHGGRVGEKVSFSLEKVWDREIEIEVGILGGWLEGL